MRGVDKDEIERGQVLAEPGSIKPHKKFLGEVYVLKKEEGGRHTPFFTNYRPQFYIRTTDVTGSVKLPEGVKMVMPGDNITMEIELITTVALEEQMRFAIREGGRPSAPASSPRSSSNDEHCEMATRKPKGSKDASESPSLCESAAPATTRRPMAATRRLGSRFSAQEVLQDVRRTHGARGDASNGTNNAGRAI